MNKIAPILLTTLLPLPALRAQDMGAFKFEIETLGGQKLTHEDFENNVVIVDFWGTWCPPCRKAVPGLVQLYKKYKHHGLEIVGLNYREKGSTAEVLQTIREFAAANGITYTLAVGTEKIRNQIVGFAGYPTMLFFKKGMKFDHLETGFDPEGASRMEKWVRKELGLDEPAAKDGDAETPEPEEKEPKAEAKIKVPDGVVYKPGLHDTGFAFTVKDTAGEEVKFEQFRGRKVVLALTSTWDHEAANTAALLNELHARWDGKGVAVLAASLEMKKAREDKLAAIEAFEKANKTTYKILPVGLAFLKKVFKPEGLPLFLVFDGKGTLVLRQRSDTKAKVLAAVNAALEE